MDVGGAPLAAAAMRAGLIDEYMLATAPVLVGGGTSVLHGPGQLGEPEPGADPDVSRRRAADQVRDQALNTRPRIGAGFGPPKHPVAVRGSAIGSLPRVDELDAGALEVLCIAGGQRRSP
jgi:hypothetical protein